MNFLNRYQQTLSVAVVLALGSFAHADDPDPLQLLKDSAKAVEAAPSASVDMVISTKLVRDDKTQDESMTFRYRTAPEGRFEFFTVAEEAGETAGYGYRVAGNDAVTMTAMLGAGRHMIEPDANGFAAFVSSPAAMGIGSGLGGIALAFLHPEAMEVLAASVETSNFLGEKEVDGEKLLHARYTVAGGVTSDVWFHADSLLVRKIVPDVLATSGVQQMAERFDTFDYQLSFVFDDWNTDAGLTAKEVRVVEPEESQLMASLYAMPEPGPHPLLGEEAPTFELTTAEGKRRGLGEANGKGAALIEFWSTNCPVCVKAMPELEKLHQQYAEQGLDYFAINIGEEPDEVAAFLKDRDLPLEAVIDTDQAVTDAYDVNPIPLIVLVGPDGRVQAAQEGFASDSASRLQQQIEATLAGEDLAAKTLDEARRREAKRLAERERLRSKLDG